MIVCSFLQFIISPFLLGGYLGTLSDIFKALKNIF